MAPATVLLESLVTLLEVAVAGLDRGALTVVIDTIAGAATLLDAPPTGHRTMSPFRPRRPAILRVVTRCSTARAAFSVRNCSISTWDQRAGDLTTHSSGVLTSALCTVIYGPLVFVLADDTIMDADTTVDANTVVDQFVLIGQSPQFIGQLLHHHAKTLQLLKHAYQVLTGETTHHLQVFCLMSSELGPNCRRPIDIFQ